MMQRSDADKDGKLSKDEVPDFMKERFDQMDTNKDGSLSLQEYNAQLAAVPLPKPNVAPALDRLDTNKDGKISLSENRAPAMAQFDRADTNKDGILSPEEQRARAKMNESVKAKTNVPFKTIVREEVAGLASISDTSRAEFTGIISINPDNTVTIRTTKCEIGNGVHTGMAMIVTEEAMEHVLHDGPRHRAGGRGRSEW